jgi:YfiR/HmsC-like
MIPRAQPIIRQRLDWPGFSSLLARSRISPLLVLLLLLAQAARSFAADPQTLTEYQIKAGFFFNFTRFVDWPESAFVTASSPILVCVLGETPLTDLVTDVALGKVVNGRAVSLRRVKASDDLRLCNLLFISAEEERHTAEILGSVKKTSTLTVGETPGFAQAGGMINFSIQENKVKLELNLEATTRVGLKVNSKLIAVSRLVSHNSAAEAN